MKKMGKLIALCSVILAVVIFSLCVFLPAVPEQKSINELEGCWDICREYEIPEKLYVIDSGTFKTIEERHMAVSLQGVVAREKPSIFIITNDMDRKYLRAIEEKGTKLAYNDADGNSWSLQTLLNEFKEYIADNGYVLYCESEKAEGLNVATNLASLYGWLPVPESLKEMAEGVGLVLKDDLTDDDYNSNFQESFFDEHKEEFDFKAIVSLRYDATGLRDLAIQQGFYIFYVDDDEDTDKFRQKVIKYAGDNVPVLGWAKYEVPYVTQASENGNMVIPSDHSHNNSILASFECEIPSQKHSETKKYTDTTKHYCALVFSDGDNIQWVQNGYSEYFQKLALENSFPISWSFSPSMQEFSPLTASMVYSQTTENDYLIAGVSGVGYMHPTEYPKRSLAEFTDITAYTMAKSGLEYVCILDSTPSKNSGDKKLENSLQYYARYDNIKGGILSLDPERYEGGKGKVYFVNDKPFVSNRMSLWHPDGEGATVTEEWLRQQAEIVNEYPADTNSVNGYSVINIHPWTISVENLSYFVSRLDEDVQLVTVDELLFMMQENIPHETAAPEN